MPRRKGTRSAIFRCFSYFELLVLKAIYSQQSVQDLHELTPTHISHTLLTVKIGGQSFFSLFKDNVTVLQIVYEKLTDQKFQ
jgi:hypothetical protein